MRAQRLHIPGAVFHITARTQGRHPWFTEDIRRSIVEFIIEGTAVAGARLYAFAVMPNHLHILMRQSVRPLGWTMQSILQRTALLVHRSCGIEGHVFERRFRAIRCDSPYYVREVIVYIHRNPVRSNLCQFPHEYGWTSHNSYLHRTRARSLPAECIQEALMLYADEEGESRAKLLQRYLSHIEWRAEQDELECREGLEGVSRFAPNARLGDVYWTAEFGKAHGGVIQPPLRDIRDALQQAARTIAPDFPLAIIRSKYGSRSVAKARREIISVLVTAGYRGSKIARVLRVSEPTVSRVATQLNRSSLEHMNLRQNER